MTVAPAGVGPDPTIPSLELGCRVCGALKRGTSHEATEQMFGLGGTFVYDECARCHSLTLRNVPSDLARFYPDSYYSYATPAPLSGAHRAALHALLFRSGGRLLAPVAPGRYRAVARAGIRRETRVLDVGGGNGKLVDELLDAGLTGECVVLDPYATRDHTRLGSRIVRTTSADCDGQFGVVMFNHSLEHHPEPRHALREAVSLLPHGGALIVRCPTVTSICWDRYGVDWVELDAPRHLTIPSEGGLFQMLTEAGLTVERSWRDGESFQLWGSELYRRGIRYAGTDPREHFSARELRAFARETRSLNSRGTGGRIAVVARRV